MKIKTIKRSKMLAHNNHELKIRLNLTKHKTTPEYFTNADM